MKWNIIVQKALQLFKNFYFVTTLSFLVWMCFFDTNNISNQLILYEKYQEFQAEKAYYQQEITSLKQKIKDLEDLYYVEQFARAKYHLKKRGEDIYLIKRRDKHEVLSE